MKDQKFRCRLCGQESIGRRQKIEQELSSHLIEKHRILDSLKMGMAVERIW